MWLVDATIVDGSGCDPLPYRTILIEEGRIARIGGTPPPDAEVVRLTHLTLPAVTLATGLIALIMRQTRAAVLNVMEQDYVTFARARGLSWSRIMVRYALRNTALPVITASGLLLIAAISGAALVESVFSLPGVGSLMVQSVNAKDVPVVQGLAFFLALIVVVVNLLVDIVALVIDPRTRTAAKG